MPASSRSDDSGGVLAGALLLLSVLLFLGVLLGAFLTVRPDVAVLLGLGAGTGPKVFLLFGALALGAFLLMWATSGAKGGRRPEDPALRPRPTGGPSPQPRRGTASAPARPAVPAAPRSGPAAAPSGRSPHDPLPSDASPGEPSGSKAGAAERVVGVPITYAGSTDFQVVGRRRRDPAPVIAPNSGS
ncbi:MAG TPA: hypothetical protein VNZ52_10595 [Candidatus Thermoplasmatota archaeon]|nr:hypothetical protein [Candidatus Thermoplasmatota archaeon]